jgi:ribosomal protein L4
LASRNIPGVSVKTSQEVNALDVVSHKECVMTRAAYDGLVKRLKS